MAKVKVLCGECAALAGREKPMVPGSPAREKCPICGRRTMVLPIRNWGTFTHEQLATARRQIKEIGLHHSQQVYHPDAKKLVDVVERTLDTIWRCEQTKHYLTEIKRSLETGKPIYKFFTDQLARWYATDIKLMNDTKAAQEARNEEIHPSPKLHVVEGGRTTTRSVRRKDSDDNRDEGNTVSGGQRGKRSNSQPSGKRLRKVDLRADGAQG